MQKKITLSPLSWAGILFLVVLLLSVRFFEQNLFYDPLLLFFKSSSNEVLPQYNMRQLLLGYFFRYTLNAVLSLAILWLVFKDIAVVKVTTMLYGLLFALFTVGLYILLSMDAPPLKGVFYLRRFLIQPLLLLLFLPAFYYQKHLKD